jgi:hypothetical protein
VLFVVAVIGLVRYSRSKKPPEVRLEEQGIEQQPNIDLEIEAERGYRTKVSGYYYFPVPEPGRPVAALIAISGPLEKETFTIEKTLFRIGAGPENDLVIDEDDYVSENHAYLRYETGLLFIQDDGSKNGTFVNQKEVTGADVSLSPGDQIRVGMSIFEVEKA